MAAAGYVTPAFALWFWFMVHRRLVSVKSEAAPAARVRLSLGLLVGLVLWFIVSYGLGSLDVFERMYGSPLVPMLAFAPPLLFMRLASRSKLLGAAVDLLPNHWLVAIQTYRVLGIIFLLLFMEGRMPPEFAIPSGVGDLLVGGTAAVVAFLLARRSPGHAGLARAWNYVGVTDLVVAVTMGAITAPTLIQLLAFDAPNDLIISYPLVTVPTFAVPFALLLHLLSLRILRTQGT